MFLLVVVGALVCGHTLVMEPGLIRAMMAACIGIVAIVVALNWPRQVAIAALILLPFLALLRRLLLDFSGWQSTDPLLLLAPVVVALLLLQLFNIERRPLAPDRISQLVLVVLAMCVLQVFNPQGGSLAAGAAALLCSTRLLRVVLVSSVVTASIVALYGLRQTWVGLPTWDAEWVRQSGYAALQVGDVTRAFGTFSSAAEYAHYLSVGIVVACAFALTGRVWLLPAVPLLAVALFYESSRGIIVTTVAALVAMVSARAGSLRGAVGAGIACIALLGLGLSLAHGPLTETARTSSDPLVSHQLGGLTDPFNEDTSTLPSHLTVLQNGLRAGLFEPLGHGIATITNAGAKLGSGTLSTEVDVSNAFYGLGGLGGAAYLALVLASLWASLKLAVRRRDAVSLACLGALVSCFGQWWNGGFYAVAPLIWFIVGYVIASRPQN
jgi:hypothetical protein